MKYAKAHDASDQSDSIIVSFDATWHSKIRQSTFSVIIRKRTPTSAKPKWLYFHINAPISRICGRAKIKSIQDINEKRAVELSKEIGIAADEITSYMAQRKSVGAYFVGKIELPDAELSIASIQEHFSYSPPQSFLFLSHDRKKIIDRLCGFNRRHQLRSEQANA
jgi:predicted transcriptional regulator